MNLHYKLYKDPDTGRYIADLIEGNIVISGDTREEIDIEIKNAVDGYVKAFGPKALCFDDKTKEYYSVIGFEYHGW